MVTGGSGLPARADGVRAGRGHDLDHPQRRHLRRSARSRRCCRAARPGSGRWRTCPAATVIGLACRPASWGRGSGTSARAGRAVSSGTSTGSRSPTCTTSCRIGLPDADRVGQQHHAGHHLAAQAIAGRRRSVHRQLQRVAAGVAAQERPAGRHGRRRCRPVPTFTAYSAQDPTGARLKSTVSGAPDRQHARHREVQRQDRRPSPVRAAPGHRRRHNTRAPRPRRAEWLSACVRHGGSRNTARCPRSSSEGEVRGWRRRLRTCGHGRFLR